MTIVYQAVGILAAFVAAFATVYGIVSRRHKEIDAKLSAVERLAESNRSALSSGSGRFASLEARMTTYEQHVFLIHELKTKVDGLTKSVDRIEAMMLGWIKRNGKENS